MCNKRKMDDKETYNEKKDMSKHLVEIDNVACLLNNRYDTCKMLEHSTVTITVNSRQRPTYFSQTQISFETNMDPLRTKKSDYFLHKNDRAIFCRKMIYIV